MKMGHLDVSLFLVEILVVDKKWRGSKDGWHHDASNQSTGNLGKCNDRCVKSCNNQKMQTEVQTFGNQAFEISADEKEQ